MSELTNRQELKQAILGVSLDYSGIVNDAIRPPETNNVAPEYGDILRSPDFLRTAVKRVRDIIYQRFSDVRIVAIRGSSGAAVGYPVAYLSSLEVCYVRKPDESSHGKKVENRPSGRPYVIIDDFVSSGKTVDSILQALGHKGCRGVIMYMAQYRIDSHWVHDDDIPYIGIDRYTYRRLSITRNQDEEVICEEI